MCQKKVEFTLKQNIENRRCYSTPSPEQIFSQGMSSFTNSSLRKRAQSSPLTLLEVTDPALYSFKAGNKPTSSCRCFTFQLFSRRNSGNNASTYLKLFDKPVSFQSLVRILARQILHFSPLNSPQCPTE